MRASPAVYFRYLIFLLIGVLLLALAFRGQDLNKMLFDLQKADFGWVLLSLLACLMAHVIRAYRWNLMIRSLGHGTPALLNTFYAVIIGYLANLAFPRMGEVTRCGVINKTDGIPIVELVGTVLAERLADLLMLGIVIALAILFQFNLLSGFLYNNILSKLTGRIGDLTLLVFAFFLLILTLIFFFILMKKKKWGISARIFQLYSGMKTGILSVKNIDNKAGFVLSSVLIWVFYGLSLYWCFFALNATSSLGPGAALSALVFGSLAMIAPVQGGIGAFHWMVSEGLTVYGIAKSDGLAYALLIHTSQTLIILLLGAFSLFLLFIRPTKKMRNE